MTSNIIPFVKKDVVLESGTMKIAIEELHAILAEGLEAYFLEPDSIITDLDFGFDVDEEGLVEFDLTIARVEDVAGRTS